MFMNRRFNIVSSSHVYLQTQNNSAKISASIYGEAKTVNSQHILKKKNKAGEVMLLTLGLLYKAGRKSTGVVLVNNRQINRTEQRVQKHTHKYNQPIFDKGEGNLMEQGQSRQQMVQDNQNHMQKMNLSSRELTPFKN